MDARVKLELMAARDALERAECGEEYSHVEAVCRRLIREAEGNLGRIDETCEARSLLLDAMIRNGDFSEVKLENIARVMDSLFVDYLSARNRLDAAKTLLGMMEYFESDYVRLFDVGYKLADLFGSSENVEIQKVVRNGCLLLWREVRDDDMEGFCSSFGRFLIVPELFGYYMFIEVLDYLYDNSSHEMAIRMIESWVGANADIDEEFQMLDQRLAANHFELGNYQAAIDIYEKWLNTRLGDERYDYLLWCGESFQELDDLDHAWEYFTEVVNALENFPDDSRVVEAKKRLAEMIWVHEEDEPGERDV
ncbi:MAG: tetratricopeptide repeat protein [Alphaproteobacteria bacterium]|nr:tetratricopeptide repeat protein [Alphaproteobacteria bacterium]